MKIVTYNVNGLRSRVSQHGSLLNLLNSLDADIICIQETKLSRHELSTDLAIAEGYEAFFSCSRVSTKGRVCYSGVVTFCRVKSAFCSSEVALPLAAEEGFTGLLENSNREDAIIEDFLPEIPLKMEGSKLITKDDFLKLDSEGRCIITDHGHFVLFNIYGPRVDPDDVERLHFKIKFFQALQRRWEAFLSQGKRVFVVGDFNIAPSAIDSCRAGPDFEENRFQKWLRSLLAEGGGPFFDVFRAKHPQRQEAYTCWPQHTGAEEFNFGSRIDLILIAGSCFHQNYDQNGHTLIDCHVKECDLLTQFKRWKPDSVPRWKGGRSLKLEGSDHIPVYACLTEIPDIALHNTPYLASRYFPKIRGQQQTIVSLLKKQITSGAKDQELSHMISERSVLIDRYSESPKRPCEEYPEPQALDLNTSGNLVSVFIQTAEGNSGIALTSKRKDELSGCCTKIKKKARQGKCSQQTLRSFFPSIPGSSLVVKNANAEAFSSQMDASTSDLDSSHQFNEMKYPNKISVDDLGSSSINPFNEDRVELDACSTEKNGNNVALLQWQKIQKSMQKSIPLCGGHAEPCVARSVKKGPNVGRGFYVCARAEGPSSNPEASCGHFQWATKQRGRGKQK